MNILALISYLYALEKSSAIGYLTGSLDPLFLFLGGIQWR
jgi:hypothetical protein